MKLVRDLTKGAPREWAALDPFSNFINICTACMYKIFLLLSVTYNSYTYRLLMDDGYNGQPQWP